MTSQAVEDWKEHIEEGQDKWKVICPPDNWATNLLFNLGTSPIQINWLFSKFMVKPKTASNQKGVHFKYNIF